jgi:hypothetical protein
MNDLLSVKLPVIYCAECATQLATHVCLITGTETLICAFCAAARNRAGNGATVTPVYPPTGWRGLGYAPPLDPIDAIALLVRQGATVLDPGSGDS